MALSLRRVTSHSFIHRKHTYIAYLPLSASTLQHRHYHHNHSNTYNGIHSSSKLTPYHLLTNTDQSEYTYHNSHFYFPYRYINPLQSHTNLLYHTKYYQSNTPKQQPKNKTPKKQTITLEKQKATQKSTLLKYINPIFIVTKTINICYNIIYYTIDSIIHPSRGLERLKNTWKSLKHHGKHFWEACKLMGTDIKAAMKIVNKLLKTGEMTYRERRQLRRVTMDVLRFVPMLIIVLIPFLEVLLPFFLIMFPNMLPSRFQTEHQKLERRKKLLSARLGMTAFFEDTLLEFVKETKSKQDAAKLIGTEKLNSLEKLLEKVKNNDEISNVSIIKLASLFDDEMALDNASVSVLRNMCTYMELNYFGTQPMLRNRLYEKIRQIRKEDQGIRKEGLDNIPLPLLKTLLRERGMRSDFEEWVLRANMNKWLELSLDHQVPVTLLIMSRIFTLQHIPGQDPTQMLAGTISSIGDATTKEMLVEKGGMDDLKGEREIIQKQDELIREEEELKELKESSKEKKDKEKVEGKVIKEDQKELEQDKIEPKRIKEVAEAAETLTADGVTDPEKQDIEDLREKLKELADETEALWEELKDSEAMKEQNMGYTVEASGIEFEVKEDEMVFDAEKEMLKRSKATDKFAKRIEKWLQKSENEANETMQQFANTLKRFNENDEDIDEEELKSVLKVGIFKDEEIEAFLKQLDEIKQKEPRLNLSQRIEKLIDEHDEDIDIKNIKKEKKEDKE